MGCNFNLGLAETVYRARMVGWRILDKPADRNRAGVLVS